MKKNLKKAISFFLILCFTITAFTSCKKPGAFSNNTKTVMTVGDYKVTYDEYRYFYYNCMLDMGDQADFTDPQTVETLKTNTENAIRKRYAIKLYCDKYNRKMSNADKKEMDEFIKSYIEDRGGEDKFKEELLNYRMTGDVFREQYELTYYYDVYLRELLFTGYDGIIPVDDQTIKSDVKNNFYHYTQIFIPFEEGSDYGENQELINSALAELKSGKSFDEVAEKYSRWTVDFRIGVYSTPGEKLQMIEDTALSLDIGEYSDVIFTSEGHHIIKRLPIEDDYIDKNLDTLLTVSATRRYNEFIDKEAATLNVEYKDYYNDITHAMLVNK